MGRKISIEHLQALSSTIRGEIVASLSEAPGNLPFNHRLALALGLKADCARHLPQSRIKKATAELERVLFAAGTVEPSEGQFTNLDDWINRHLLQRGPELLIDESSRRAVLARQRDKARRKRRTAHGRHSARIEMLQEAWRALQNIQARFNSGSTSGVTRGETLERIIAEYLRGIVSCEAKGIGHNRKSAVGKRTVPNQNRDLFAHL